MKHHISKIKLLFVVFATTGCGQFNLVPEVSVNFQDPTNVTETGFLISWSINSSEYSSLTFILAEDPSFNSIVATRSFQGTSAKATQFESLRGARTYYYRISLVMEPGSLFISDTKSIELPYQQDPVSFTTPDSFILKGSVFYLKSIKEKRPAVIMMHELGFSVNGWFNSDIMKALVSEGYVCLIYSNRGHGLSSYFEDPLELMRNPKYLANDLRGAMSYMNTIDLVQADSIALMGGSMGATMAVSGSGDDAVLTCVALSVSNNNIDYMFPGIALKSILYIAAENDMKDSRDLYQLTAEPRKLMIIENSAAHGTELLDIEDVNEEILQWILQQLPIMQ